MKTKDIRNFLLMWAGIGFAFLMFYFFKYGEVKYSILFLDLVVFLCIFLPKNLLLFIYPLYRGWILLGEGIGFCTSRFILVFLFFVIFTPIALFFRLIKRDSLNQKWSEESSYFINRDSKPQSMKNQF